LKSVENIKLTSTSSIKEAMMCGICVVGSDSGGPLEIIDDGINGLLFKTFDAVDLADKLALLQKNRELRIKYAFKGNQKAMDMFESQKQFEQLREMLK